MSRRRARELLKWWLSMMERVALSGLDDAQPFLLLNLIQPYFELAGSERKKLERLLSRDRHQEVSSLPGPRRLRRRPAGKARRRACSKARRTPLCANSQPSSVRSRKPRPEYGRLSPPRSLSATWTELSSQLACGYGPSRLIGRPRPSNSSRRFERQGTHGCAGAPTQSVEDHETFTPAWPGQGTWVARRGRRTRRSRGSIQFTSGITMVILTR